MLRSLVNDAKYEIGIFETPSLAELRQRLSVRSTASPASGYTVSTIAADVSELHRAKEYAGTLFMVASQFNLLEMTGPDITPEDGVGRYVYDRTQGPACAIAAGAATIFRNYFVPIGDQTGQTATRQLNMLEDLGAAFARRLSLPVSNLWEMRNGYALCSATGLRAIGAYLAAAPFQEREAFKGLLRIGLHYRTEVTNGAGPPQFVSQAFCSALPVAYSSIEPGLWEPFARFILEAAYEATLLAAAGNHRSGHSNTVVLTHLGGGAFGNPKKWIRESIDIALQRAQCSNLDIRLATLRLSWQP